MKLRIDDMSKADFIAKFDHGECQRFLQCRVVCAGNSILRRGKGAYEKTRYRISFF
jgi:hypothetical protein